MHGAFTHPALFYAGADEYLAGTLPFINAGLAAGEPVLVAVPGAHLELIRRGLGDDAERVRLRDMAAAGRNPGRIIPGVLLAFAAEHAGRPVRIIGEPIWAARSSTEYPACAQHEALINAAFAGRHATILCPYDVGRLPRQWVADAYRTHPVVEARSTRWSSPHYGDPRAVAADFNRPLPAPPAHARTVAVEQAALPHIRRLVTVEALNAGLDAERVADLTLAVHELAANTVEHSGGTGTLALWRDGDQFCCQLSDGGHIADPLAGRLPVPARQATGGRGLLLVNRLCDLVRIHTRPGGTTIRVHMAR